MTFTVTHALTSSQYYRARHLACRFISLAPRSAKIWGHVVFATQETSPYDIAVVSLEEELEGVHVPVPTEHFHEGKGQRGPLIWGGPLEGSQCWILKPCISGSQSPRPTPPTTPAGLVSQGGIKLAGNHPDYSALAGDVVGGFPSCAQRAYGAERQVESPAMDKACCFPAAV